MKKTYRLTIDYMIEINEKVKADGEYSRELLEKTQHIMDAFFRSPQVLHEFIKERLYWGFLDCDVCSNDLGELIGIKDEHEYMPLLSKYLPYETVSYLLGIFCPDKEFPGSNKEEEDGRWLVLSQFGKFAPLNASFKDMESWLRKEKDDPATRGMVEILEE